MNELIKNAMPALALISVLTGLITEGIKRMLNEIGGEYKSNVLACVVSVVVTLGYMASLVILESAVVNAEFLFRGFVLMLLSWLTSMLGYDKVKQTIGG